MEWFQGLKVYRTGFKGFVKREKLKENKNGNLIGEALERMKETKGQQCHQQSQEEMDDVYAQMLQNLEGNRADVRSSISKAFTISDEEHWLALTEDDFLAIQ